MQLNRKQRFTNFFLFWEAFERYSGIIFRDDKESQGMCKHFLQFRHCRGPGPDRSVVLVAIGTAQHGKRGLWLLARELLRGGCCILEWLGHCCGTNNPRKDVPWLIYIVRCRWGRHIRCHKCGRGFIMTPFISRRSLLHLSTIFLRGWSLRLAMISVNSSGANKPK